MSPVIPELQPPIDLPDSVAPVKSLWKNWVYCPEKNVQMHLKPTIV